MHDIAQHEDDQYIIFASDAPLELTKEFLRISGVPFKQLLGRYKGVDEDSFIINAANKDKIVSLIEKQESILALSSVYRNGDRLATLHYKNALPVVLGHFVEVTKAEAEKQDAYTLDLVTNRYYVAG